MEIQKLKTKLSSHGLTFDGENFSLSNKNGTMRFNFETGTSLTLRGFWQQKDGFVDAIFFDCENEIAMNNVYYWIEWYKCGGMITRENGTIGI